MSELSIPNGQSNIAGFEMITYTGTGKSGASNPCSVTFSQPVKAIFILEAITGIFMLERFNETKNSDGTTTYSGGRFADMRTTKGWMTVEDTTTEYRQFDGMSCADFDEDTAFDALWKCFGKRSSDNKTWSWYITAGPKFANYIGQFNVSGHVYHVIGIY